MPRSSATHGLALPSREQLAILREEARNDGTLPDLRERIAALLAVGERFGIVHSELVRLAVARLEVERDIGNQLEVAVRPGRPRKRSPHVTISEGQLPEGVSKQQAMRFRALARVPESVFQGYLESVAREQRVPTSTGARRFAAGSGGRNAARAFVRPKLRLAAEAIAAIGRVLAPDVLVGPPLLPAKQVVAPDAPRVLDQLRGDVLVLECSDPDWWIEAAMELCDQGAATKVVMVLPLDPHSRWYAKVVERRWPCWVPARSDVGGRPLVVVDVGGRAWRVLTPAKRG